VILATSFDVEPTHSPLTSFPISQIHCAAVGRHQGSLEASIGGHRLMLHLGAVTELGHVIGDGM
jgi:hypothetical protein